MAVSFRPPVRGVALHTLEQHDGLGGDFLCDFIADLEVGLAVVAPEFAAGDLATVPDMQAFCGGTLVG